MDNLNTKITLAKLERIHAEIKVSNDYYKYTFLIAKMELMMQHLKMHIANERGGR